MARKGMYKRLPSNKDTGVTDFETSAEQGKMEKKSLKKFTGKGSLTPKEKGNILQRGKG